MVKLRLRPQTVCLASFLRLEENDLVEQIGVNMNHLFRIDLTNNHGDAATKNGKLARP